MSENAFVGLQELRADDAPMLKGMRPVDSVQAESQVYYLIQWLNRSIASGFARASLHVGGVYASRSRWTNTVDLSRDPPPATQDAGTGVDGHAVVEISRQHPSIRPAKDMRWGASGHTQALRARHRIQ